MSVNITKRHRELPLVDIQEGNLLKGCFIAGGAILSSAMKKPINDIDIYPKSRDDFERILTDMVEEQKYTVQFVTDKAITIKTHEKNADTGELLICQIMFSDEWFSVSEKIFERFDFTVCMAAFDCDTKEYHYHPDFWPDLGSRTLRVNTGTLYPINSLIRIKKYREKGFDISKAETVKLALAVAMGKLPTSWEELEEQIGGTYGRVVRLASEGTEFSLSAAIETLSTLDDMSFVEVDESHKYTTFKPKQWTKVLCGETIEYAPFEAIGTTSIISINRGPFVVDSETRMLTHETLTVPTDHKRTAECTVVRGYVQVFEIEGFAGVIPVNNVKKSQQWEYSKHMVDTFEEPTHIPWQTALSDKPFAEDWAEIPFAGLKRRVQYKSMLVEVDTRNIHNYTGIVLPGQGGKQQNFWVVSLFRKVQDA